MRKREARNFVIGIAVGVPAGMLLGDLAARRRRRQWEARAHEWIEIGRERAAHLAEKAVRAAEERIRELPGNAGRNLGDLLDREAGNARERSSRTAEDAMRGGEAALNHVSRQELLAVYGIGPVLADRILQGRPYGSDREVVERGIVGESIFDQMQRQLLQRYRRTA